MAGFSVCVIFLLFTATCAANDAYFKRRAVRLTPSDVVFGGQRIKEFGKKEVVRCFDNLAAKIGRRTHVAFVGDSLVRQVFLAFLQVKKNIQLLIQLLGCILNECHYTDDSGQRQEGEEELDVVRNSTFSGRQECNKQIG